MQPRDGGEYQTLDVRDDQALSSFIRENKPDCVAMLAAYREPDYCEENPQETRRLNTAPLAVLVRELPPEVPLLLVSTDYVFDGENPPYSEESRRNPLSEYGRSKMEAEDLVMGRPGGIVLRVPLLMGWTGNAGQSGFFSQLIRDLQSAEPLPLDDVLKRYPVWTRDVGAGIRSLFERQAEGVFHLSTTRALTRYRAALELAELLGWPSSHLQPSSQVIPRKAVRPKDAHLAIDKWLASGLPEPNDFKDVALRFLEHFNMIPHNM